MDLVVRRRAASSSRRASKATIPSACARRSPISNVTAWRLWPSSTTPSEQRRRCPEDGAGPAGWKRDLTADRRPRDQRGRRVHRQRAAAMLDLQLSAWSRLWTARGMTYGLTVFATADEVPVETSSAIQEALHELLDNVDRHGARGGLVHVDASVSEDFLVFELRNHLEWSPRGASREGSRYGAARATTAPRHIDGTITLRQSHPSSTAQRCGCRYWAPSHQPCRSDGPAVDQPRGAGRALAVSRLSRFSVGDCDRHAGDVCSGPPRCRGSRRLPGCGHGGGLWLRAPSPTRRAAQHSSPDALSWTLAACSIAIVASAVMPQAVRYQQHPPGPRLSPAGARLA